MLHEHQRVRVLRNDTLGPLHPASIYSYTVTVLLPQSRLKRITKRLSETLKADNIDFFRMVGESPMARLHLIATRTPAGTRHEYNADALEREVALIACAGTTSCNRT